MRNFKRLTIDYYCKMYYEQCYIEHYIVNSVHGALYTVQFTVYMYTVQCTSVQCTVYIVQCTLCSD